MRENEIEAHMRRQAEKRGGLLLKFVSPQNSGVPDRLLLHPALTRPVLIELKAPDKTPRPLQLAMHDILRKKGALVFVVDSKKSASDLLDNLLSCAETVK